MIISAPPTAMLLPISRSSKAERLGGFTRTGTLGAWAALLALVLSTQFLFQPFIWRDFEFGDIMSAWLGILRDRLIVAMCIAVALSAILSRHKQTRGWQMLFQAAAIIAGAIAGELLLQVFAAQDQREDLLSFGGRVIRWTFVGGAIAALLYLWRSGSDIAAAAEITRIDDARLRRVAISAQLEMLQRQIEPHFLFNTLATIRRLQETDPNRSQKLLSGLFDYMAATLGGQADRSATLGDEVALVCAYLDVCAARMTGPLIVKSNVPQALAAIEFPSLILATLAENSIKHGVDPTVGGEIVISAERRGDLIAVTISDTGRGFGEKVGGTGIGLANIGERLRLLYGPRATLTLNANIPQGVTATILIAGSPL